MLALFLFGVFISGIVASACGLIGYGLYTDKKGREEISGSEEYTGEYQ